MSINMSQVREDSRFYGFLRHNHNLFSGVQQEMEECDRAEEKRRAIEDDDDAPSGSGLSKL